MARVEFAPDGIHYQTVKKGRIEKLWDYFTQNREIRLTLITNPFARFRLVGDEKTIGILAYDKRRKEFLHLSEGEATA